jgi:DNA-binding FrmR family transcriptional regulator
MTHQTHPEITRRLKRADGHLQRIITMIDEGRPLIELAQQLQAVEKAIDNAKKALIHDYIDQSMRTRGSKRRPSFNEVKEITKYL